MLFNIEYARINRTGIAYFLIGQLCRARRTMHLDFKTHAGLIGHSVRDFRERSNHVNAAYSRIL